MSDTKTPAPVHPLLEGTTPEQAQDEACEIYTSTDSPEHVGEIFRIYQDGKILTGPLKYDEGAYEWLNRLRQAYCRGRLASAPTLAAENARLRAALEALVQHSTESHMCYPDCVENAREVLASLIT